jgi:hypothetical protein
VTVATEPEPDRRTAEDEGEEQDENHYCANAGCHPRTHPSTVTRQTLDRASESTVLHPYDAYPVEP